MGRHNRELQRREKLGTVWTEHNLLALLQDRACSTKPPKTKRYLRELPTRAEVSILINEAITRNSRLLLEALDGHTHTDDGVVFSIPPGIEPLGVAPAPSPTPGAAQ